MPETSSDAIQEILENQPSPPDTRPAGTDPGENGAPRFSENMSSGKKPDNTPRIIEPQPTDAQGAGSVNVAGWERKASTVGGGALTLFGLYGLSRRSWAGFALAALGGGLIYRGVTGHCAVYKAAGLNTAQPDKPSINMHVQKTMTINKTPEELYRFWRNFENLPRFMDHLQSVSILEGNRSHWVAKAPLGRSVAWDAEIINDRENELIAWRSLPGADIVNAGSVKFVPAPLGRGTEVHVSMAYNPPAGMAGAAVAKLLGEEPSLQVEDDLRRFKRLMETGEIATTHGQSAGRRSLIGKAFQPQEG